MCHVVPQAQEQYWHKYVMTASYIAYMQDVWAKLLGIQSLVSRDRGMARKAGICDDDSAVSHVTGPERLYHGLPMYCQGLRCLLTLPYQSPATMPNIAMSSSCQYTQNAQTLVQFLVATINSQQKPSCTFKPFHKGLTFLATLLN